MDYPKTVPGVGLLAGKFTDGDPVAGTPPSLDPSEWANALTDEVLGVITEAGLVPTEGSNAQLAQALNILFTSPAFVAATYLPLTGGALSSTLTIENAAPLNLTGGAGNNRCVQMFTGSVTRWLIGASGDPETGGDAGSNFIVAGYTDAGAYKFEPLFIDRVTGAVNLVTAPLFPGPPAADNSPAAANTAWVTSRIGALGTLVNSFNARTGAIALESLDVTGALTYTPVQQGTGVGQAANVVKIGWDGAGKIKATIDATDEGNIAMESWALGTFDANGAAAAAQAATETWARATFDAAGAAAAAETATETWARATFDAAGAAAAAETATLQSVAATYLPLTGGALSSTLTIGNAAPLNLNGPAASNRVVEICTAGVTRWEVGANSSPETGGDTGSDFVIAGYTDAGVNKFATLLIDRVTGAVSLSSAPLFPSPALGDNSATAATTAFVQTTLGTLGAVGSAFLYGSTTSFSAGSSYAGSTFGQAGTWLCMNSASIQSTTGLVYVTLFVRIS